MNNEVYQSPQSNIEQLDDYHGSVLKGITVGVLITLLGSVFGAILLTIIFFIIYSMQGYTMEQLETIVDKDVLLLSSFLVVSFLFTVLGSYICARIINHRVYGNALLLGVALFIIGLLFYFLLPGSTSDEPLWFTIGDNVGIFVGVLLGGYMWLRHRKTTY